MERLPLAFCLMRACASRQFREEFGRLVQFTDPV